MLGVPVVTAGGVPNAGAAVLTALGTVGTDTGGLEVSVVLPVPVFAVGVAVALDEVPLSHAVIAPAANRESSSMNSTNFLEAVFNDGSFLPGYFAV